MRVSEGDSKQQSVSWKDTEQIEAFDEAREKAKTQSARTGKMTHDTPKIIALFEKATGIRLTERSVKRRLTEIEKQQREYYKFTGGAGK